LVGNITFASWKDKIKEDRREKRGPPTFLRISSSFKK
jgi:hypothetical protein